MSEGMDAWGVGIFPAVVWIKTGAGEKDWHTCMDYIGHRPDHGPATTAMLNLDILRRVKRKADELGITLYKIIRWSDGQRASFKGGKAMFGSSQVLKQVSRKTASDLSLSWQNYSPRASERYWRAYITHASVPCAVCLRDWTRYRFRNKFLLPYGCAIDQLCFLWF